MDESSNIKQEIKKILEKIMDMDMQLHACSMHARFVRKHAPFVHMFVGVCICMHAHVT